MESSAKAKTNTNSNTTTTDKQIDKISLDVDKIKLSSEAGKEDDDQSKQFEAIAEKNKELADDLCDKPVALQPEEGPENEIKDVENLFDPNATWETLGVTEKLREGLLEMGFVKPSKIQSSTFPIVMKQPYSHLIAQSPNGSGKTGAFGIATLARIDESDKCIQAVVLAHTKELVNQIAENIGKMAKMTSIKVTALEKEKLPNKSEVGQVIVTTPGTFGNVVFNKRMYDMSHLRVFVLDEADYMFNTDITMDTCEKAFKYFKNNKLQVQVLSFSATYTKENFSTFKKHFKKAAIIEMKKEALTLKNVRQLYYKCKNREDKVNFVEEYLKRSIENERVIIFVNSRDFTAKLQQILVTRGYKVYILMGGNMDPEERKKTVEKFKKGEIQILITTNLLARGFDERLVKLIINFDLPITKDKEGEFIPDIETYLHRIGRTGRFGTKGIGLTLVSDERELRQLKEIEDYYKSNIEEIKSLDDLLEDFKKIIEGKF